MGHGVTVAFTNTGGGDHEGADWTVDGLTISGTHYGIGTFTVSSGQTATINTNVELYIYAGTISVVGTIQGDAKGYPGNYAGSGSGPGAGSYAGYAEPNLGWGGGGGAGYAGAGGAGQHPSGGGSGGAAYGTWKEMFVYKGSSGGGTASGTGGSGGALVALYANTLTVTGTITCIGSNGYGGSHGGSGGGSGGGILLSAGNLTISGILSVNGGNGGQTTSLGGGGSGGRIKLASFNINTAGSTITYAYGTGANNGAVGTYWSLGLGICYADANIGQTFILGTVNAAVIEKVNVWVETVTTAADAVLTVWDSISKNTSYGTATIASASLTTGSSDFIFSEPIRLPDGTPSYYLEFTTTGSFELATYGISSYAGGDLYINGYIVTRFDLYHQIYNFGHVNGVIVYNNTYTSVKCNVSNIMPTGSEFTINVDNTGTIQYIDDYSDNKYLADYSTVSGVTYSAGKISIADAGYITYLIDTKYPVDGIPTLTSTIDITSETPTIQISSDGSAWYDIGTAIVDNVSTAYSLDSTILHLDGLTTFYYRVDCTGTGVVTCDITYIQLDINITTIDAENPVIVPNITNTFKCDQNVNSSFQCTVDLVYSEKRWV